MASLQKRKGPGRPPKWVEADVGLDAHPELDTAATSLSDCHHETSNSEEALSAKGISSNEGVMRDDHGAVSDPPVANHDSLIAIADVDNDASSSKDQSAQTLRGSLRYSLRADRRPLTACCEARDKLP